MGDGSWRGAGERTTEHVGVNVVSPGPRSLSVRAGVGASVGRCVTAAATASVVFLALR